MPSEPTDHADQQNQAAYITQLEQQITLYRAILDEIDDLILYKGPESRIVYANRAFRDYYGMSLDQLQGLIDAPFNEPDYTQQYIRDDQHVWTTGERLDVVEPVTRFDGEINTFSTLKVPIRDHTQVILGTLGVSRNISSQQAIQAQLTAQEERIRRLTANVPGMVYQFLLTADGHMSFPYVSNGSIAIYGMQPETIQADAQTIIGLIHPDNAEAFRQTVAQSAAELTTWEWEGRTRLGNAEKYLQGIARPVRLPNGDTLWDGILLDQTERQQTIHEIAHVQRRYELVVASSGQIVYDYDIVTSAISWSGAIATVLGYTLEAMSGGVDQWSELIHPDDMQHALALLDQAQAACSLYEVQYRFRHQDGSYVWLNDRGFFVAGADGTAVRMLGMMRDVSRQQQDEQERTRLHEHIVAIQAAALRELSTPLIPISDSTVIMPLIGSIDSARANQLIEALLHGVAEHRSRIAIIDLTGVPVVDTHVASAILQAAQAVRLLGTEVILTGIRPEIAQTLVGLGVDMRGVATRGDLQSGIEWALARTRRN